MRLCALVAGMYVEVARSSWPFLAQYVWAEKDMFPQYANLKPGAKWTQADAKGAVLECAQSKCGPTLAACAMDGTCGHQLKDMFRGVLMNDLTSAGEDLVACSLFSKCLELVGTGQHASIHNVRLGDDDSYVWREQKKGLSEHVTKESQDKAVLATSFGCPSLLPVTDAQPEVRTASGLVQTGGMIMPRMDGTLQQWVRAFPEGAFPASAEPCVEAMGRQISAALSCIHQRGYAHNDVHNQNILYKNVAGAKCPSWFLGDFELMEPMLQESTHRWESTAPRRPVVDTGMGRLSTSPHGQSACVTNECTDWKQLAIDLYHAQNGDVSGSSGVHVGPDIGHDPLRADVWKFAEKLWTSEDPEAVARQMLASPTELRA